MGGDLVGTVRGLGEDWLASVGLLAWAGVLGLSVDIALIGGRAEPVVKWPDGMMWALRLEVWVGAEGHRAGLAPLWSVWGPVAVVESVVDAELLCLRGHRAIWCGAVGQVRLRELLPVSVAAWRCARRAADCANLWVRKE